MWDLKIIVETKVLDGNTMLVFKNMSRYDVIEILSSDPVTVICLFHEYIAHSNLFCRPLHSLPASGEHYAVIRLHLYRKSYKFMLYFCVGTDVVVVR